jgi:lysophospholipase L1-like esterase
MHPVLVYSDSLSWGLIPGTRERLQFHERWPGIVERTLNAYGQHVRMIEDCLNGRRTVWDDPVKPGRNGGVGLAQRIESHSPLSLVILMLGTNDFQFSHPFSDAWSAALGITTLVTEIRKAPIEPGMSVPPILIVCPPQVRVPLGHMAFRFRDAAQKSAGLADAYRQAAADLGCHFFDAETATDVSPVDGVHLDADRQLKLGHALAPVIQSILDATPSPPRPA